MSPVTHTQQSDVREPEKTGAVVWWSNLGLIYISMRVREALKNSGVKLILNMHFINVG